MIRREGIKSKHLCCRTLLDQVTGFSLQGSTTDVVSEVTDFKSHDRYLKPDVFLSDISVSMCEPLCLTPYVPYPMSHVPILMSDV